MHQVPRGEANGWCWLSTRDISYADGIELTCKNPMEAGLI